MAALVGASAIMSGTIGEHNMRPALIKEGEEGLKRIKDWEVRSTGEDLKARLEVDISSRRILKVARLYHVRFLQLHFRSPPNALSLLLS